MEVQHFATKGQLAALGETVLAARVTGGKVPESCLGLSIEGELTQRYVAGKKAGSPHHGKLWWVHPGPYKLQFAPVDAAPEAGVQLVLEVEAPAGLLTDYLAYWLDAHNSPSFDLTDLEEELRGDPLLQLPPCLQPEEKRRICEGLSAALIRRMGIRCCQLKRVDLFPVVDCAASLCNGSSVEEGMSMHAVQPVAEPRISKIFPLEKSALPDIAGVSADQEKLLAAAVAIDARLEHRLFVELPRLADRLGAVVWPDDLAAFDAHRTLLNRVRHLASTTGRLPSLASRVGFRSIPAVTVRLLVAESRRAAEGLDEAWSLLDGQTDAVIPHPATQYLLERVVMSIEQAVARRKTPWWQV